MRYDFHNFKILLFLFVDGGLKFLVVDDNCFVLCGLVEYSF